MKITKILLAMLAVPLLVATCGTGARADTLLNRRTVVSFSQPVEIPGQVLPAGKYTIELYESFSYRHIVRIFNADRSKIFATILAIPNYRLTPTNETTMTFGERPANAPQALKAWFYPGDNFGQEFVYPKARASARAGNTRNDRGGPNGTRADRTTENGTDSRGNSARKGSHCRRGIPDRASSG